MAKSNEFTVEIGGKQYAGKFNLSAMRELARRFGKRHYAALEKELGSILDGSHEEYDVVDYLCAYFHVTLSRGSFEGDNDFTEDTVADMLTANELDRYLAALRSSVSFSSGLTPEQVRDNLEKGAAEGVQAAPLPRKIG